MKFIMKPPKQFNKFKHEEIKKSKNTYAKNALYIKCCILQNLR